MEQGFDPMLGMIGGGTLVLVIVSNMLATRRIEDDADDSPQLPG
jgi:hypothetical protein